MLWRECTLQIYCTGHGRIDYFVVIDKNDKAAKGFITFIESEKELLEKLEGDFRGMIDHIAEQGRSRFDISLLSRPKLLS